MGLRKTTNLSKVIKLMNHLFVLLLLLLPLLFLCIVFSPYLNANSIMQFFKILALHDLFHGDRHSGEPVLKTKQAIFICLLSPQNCLKI